LYLKMIKIKKMWKKVNKVVDIQFWLI
jgi:hypothetical protein